MELEESDIEILKLLHESKGHCIGKTDLMNRQNDIPDIINRLECLMEEDLIEYDAKEEIYYLAYDGFDTLLIREYTSQSGHFIKLEGNKSKDPYRIRTDIHKSSKMKSLLSILLALFTIACNPQKKEATNTNLNAPITAEIVSQIAEYVTCAFEDSKGHLWFGTLQKGMARYDGTQLKYFTKKDGLPSNRATSIAEDKNGIYWISTGEGLTKWDGQIFTNFIVKENDWSSNTIGQVLIDRKGQFWVGTWGGVYKFDGQSFTAFPIPYPKVKTTINEDTKNWITEIEEDEQGNIWFGRDGYGACKYDGTSFKHFLKKDGLHSNNVTEIEFDGAGNIWFGSRVAEKDHPDPMRRAGKGGVNKLVDNKFISFPEIKGFNDGDVYSIYKNNQGEIWISTQSNGVYQYNGQDFKNYSIPISVMNMTNDRRGNLWLAGAGGLYKINKDDEIINVTTQGPWE